MKAFNAQLPMGYNAKIESAYWSWDKANKKQYMLLFLVIVIIFFIS